VVFDIDIVHQPVGAHPCENTSKIALRLILLRESRTFEIVCHIYSNLMYRLH